MRDIVKRPQMLTGCVIALLFILTAIFGRFIMPNNPLSTDVANTLAPMSAQYPLGTDDLGRCVLSRLIAGCGTTLGTAVIIELSVFIIGFFLGMAAGYIGGVLDTVIMGIIDILLAFPSLIIALCIAGIMGAGLKNLVLAMILVYWVEYARMTRNIVLSLKQKFYVTAAKAVGGRTVSIIWRHILPNSLPRIISCLALNMSYIIVGISSLSFIGLGVQPPMPEWGAILNDARAYMGTNPQMLIGSLVCIVLSVSCFQMIGEGMRDYLNPRHIHLPPPEKRERKNYA